MLRRTAILIKNALRGHLRPIKRYIHGIVKITNATRDKKATMASIK
tara:strand:- start:505 stop:642 length:138 start_codon:yes stop_codon:yes gene_type:complete